MVVFAKDDPRGWDSSGLFAWCSQRNCDVFPLNVSRKCKHRELDYFRG